MVQQQEQQYTEHETLMDEYASLENFSPEERLSYAKKRRQEQLKLYDAREAKPELFPPHHASHNKNIRFEINIEIIEAAARDAFEEVEQLMQQGVSPDLQDEDGLSALHQAVIEDCSEVVETLIKFGADLNIKDADLWTPLHAAVACSNYNLVKYLVVKGASLVEINADGNMPIDLVEDNEEIELFLDEAMTQAGFNEDALDEIRTATATLMLEELRDNFHEGCSLDVQGDQGETVMHIAAANGYDEVVEYLLDHGAKIDVIDHDDWQPIHAAACWGHDKIIEILVNHGADLDAATKDGETPYDLTEDEELQGMIIELKESGTKTRELKRSQSNSSRTLSVRRTSIVEKHRISVNDAKQEGIFRQNSDFMHVVFTGEENEEEEMKTNGDISPPPVFPPPSTTTSQEEKGKSQSEPSEVAKLSPVVIDLPTKNDRTTECVQMQGNAVKYNSTEQKITIETDGEEEELAPKPLDSSPGQSMVGVQGKYTPSEKDTSNKVSQLANNAVRTDDVDVELGETHGHNTAAVSAKNEKQLTESTDISVKKKCCVIL